MQPLVQRIRGLWGVTALLALLMLLVSGAAWAQNAQGTIVGHVTDPSGAIVPGATVTVLDLSTGLAHT
ncbi:MAG TPA: carboxypeptidase-like regulatory domain-containing protein, partial [Acidobacteriaceae bacterium]|nr:carboxypeptidase-like regulatory domain-containing protein [Acidobacteriaceae bacterium]